jgi:hypothetical protein
MSKKNPNFPTDPFSQTSIKILTKRMKKIEIGEKVCKAISDWYYENGKPEPLWYVPKNPEWWESYLKSLDNPE